MLVVNGDSGSAVLDCTGQAVGSIAKFDVGVSTALSEQVPVHPHGTHVISLYAPALARAEEALGIRLDLLRNDEPLTAAPWC